MSKLTWDQVGDRLYETGVDRGVLYKFENKKYGNGVAWNGLTAVNENPSGGEVSTIYADNIEYLNLQSVEKFGITIEAYMYPDEFEECDGSASLANGIMVAQQSRKRFGFSYRTLVGNDEEGTEYGYKIHLVYGCLSTPSSKDNSTMNDNTDPTTYSWEITCTPVVVPDYKPSATLVIDSRSFKKMV